MLVAVAMSASAAGWDRIMRCEREHTLNGHQMMFHFGTHERHPENFHDRLPSLIKDLKKKGYRFVSINEMMENK